MIDIINIFQASQNSDIPPKELFVRYFTIVANLATNNLLLALSLCKNNGMLEFICIFFTICATVLHTATSTQWFLVVYAEADSGLK